MDSSRSRKNLPIRGCSEMKQNTSDKSPEQRAWQEEIVKRLDAAQPYSEFERLLADAEVEKKLLFGDGEECRKHR